MNLFFEFSRKYPNAVCLAVLLGMLAGLCNALLIPVVVSAVLGDAQDALAETARRTVFGFEVSHFGFACVFFGLCLAIFVSRLLSRVVLSQVSMNLTAALRIRLCGMITSAPIADIEAAGPSRLTSILMEDVGQIIVGGQLFPGLLTSAATLAGTLGFLYYLNAAAFKMVMLAILFGVLTYQLPLRAGARLFRASRAMYDQVQEAVRGLIYGAKELKLDAGKREQYFRRILVESQQRLLSNDKRANTTFIAAAVYGDMIGFLVIGIIAFFFVNYHALRPDDVISVVMALLYVTGPLTYIMGALPQIAVAKTAYRNVEQVLGEIGAEELPAAAAPLAPWEQIVFKGIGFRHASDQRHDGFTVGPLDLTLRKGEITFVVGGNGSGKSTLSKIVSLHYPPSFGSISFGHQMVGAHNVEHCRQAISTIFTDYYLFDRLLCARAPGQDALIAHYLGELGLQDKVSIDGDGMFSTTSLSDGQRKRLALLVALLDDKQLYVFDEWAADQDPAFKDIFYRRLLPELKSRGKAVVVISHDDRYFDVADRLLTLDNGKILGAPPQPAHARTA